MALLSAASEMRRSIQGDSSDTEDNDLQDRSTMMRRALLILLVIACGVWAIKTHRSGLRDVGPGEGRITDRRASEAGSTRRTTRPRSGEHGLMTAFRLTNTEFPPGYGQFIKWIDRTSLAIVNRETLQGGVRWEQTPEEVYYSSFAILGVSARTGDDYCIIGEDRQEHIVLERWTRLPVKGSLTAYRPEATSPIGIPVGGLIPTVVQPVGGTYVPPDQRRGSASMKRSAIDLDCPGGAPVALAVDPDARFVLYVTGNGIYQRVLDPSGGAASIVADSVQVPGCGDILTLSARQHASYGRCFVGRLRLNAHVLLVDQNNDGVFEVTTILDQQTYDLDFDESNILDYFYKA